MCTGDPPKEAIDVKIGELNWRQCCIAAGSLISLCNATNPIDNKQWWAKQSITQITVDGFPDIASENKLWNMI